MTAFRFVFALLVISVSHVTADDAVSFRRDIAPILRDNCVACHDAKKAEGGYRLDTYDQLVKAGDSGQAPIARDRSETSELLRRLKTSDEFERMPAESKPLPAEQIDLVANWIAAGAKFDGEDSGELLAFVIPVSSYPDPPDVYPAPVPITALAVSADGTQVYAAGYHEITVWNAEDAKLVRRIKNISQRVYALEAVPDAAALAVACGQPGRSGELRLVDLASGKVQSVGSRTSDVVLDIAFRPGGSEIAVAAADHKTRILDRRTLAAERVLASHADWVTAVAWSDDGSRLASASRDRSVKVFDPDTGQLIASYSGHGEVVRDVAFTSDGKQVLSVGDDKKLHRWNADNAKKVATVDLGSEGQKLIRRDGLALVCCRSGRVLKVDLSANKVTQEFIGHRDWVLSVAMHHETGQIFSGSFDGEVRLWNAADGALIKSWIAKP